MQGITEEVNAAGYYPDTIQVTGPTFYRFKKDQNDKGKSAWYQLYENVGDDGELFYVYVGGDWRTGEKIKICSKKNISPKENVKIQARFKESEALYKKELELRREEAKNESQEIWDKAFEGKTHPYAEKKKLKGEFGTRIFIDQGSNWLIIPVRNINGNLMGLQKILPNGQKYFHPGTAKKGSFHLIGGSINDEVYICEGFATGASINMATEKPVVIAFDAGNLEPVTREIRLQYPHAKIIICGDDDRGTQGNPGKRFAEACTKAGANSAIFPIFKEPKDELTDFNDLHCEDGLEAVKAQLVELPIKETDSLNKNEMFLKTPIIIEESEDGKISEPMVVQGLLNAFSDNMVKKNGDLFFYLNGVWKYLDNDKIDELKAAIFKAMGQKARSSSVESAFSSFCFHIKTSPKDLFQPNPYCINFTNGTLHVIKGKDQNWTMEFHPHNKEDYLITQIPMSYEKDNKEENHEFVEMVNRLFVEDSDKDEKILTIKQMYGACLAPIFPHLFMLHGLEQTGKTTLIIIAKSLLKNENTSSIEPYAFKGFNMASMAGKLANIVTDIDTAKPIEDANIKKIEDRIPVYIDRKHKEPLYAPLPAIHIFGGNGIPPTLDGSSKAHARRWSFIEFKSFKATGLYDKSYPHWVFEQSPRGILNFAIEGLKLLLDARGHYMNPTSGKVHLNEWMNNADIVQQFLDAIKEIEVKNGIQRMYVFGADLSENRVTVFNDFIEWCKSQGLRETFTRNWFYKQLRAKKFVMKPSSGINYIYGIGTIQESEVKSFTSGELFKKS